MVCKTLKKYELQNHYMMAFKELLSHGYLYNLKLFSPKVATVESGRMFWIHQKQIDVGKMRVSRGFSREERRISSPSGSTNSMRDTESYRVVGSPACGSKCWQYHTRSELAARGFCLSACKSRRDINMTQVTEFRGIIVMKS